MSATLQKPSLNKIDADWLRDFSKHRSEPAWLTDLRLKAWAQYDSLPWPGGRDERWKRTQLELLNFDELVFKPTPAPSDVKPSAAQGYELMSLEEGLVSRSDFLRSAWETAVLRAQANKFLNLTLALGNGGSLLYIPRNKHLSEPIRHDFGSGEERAALFPLHFVLVDQGAEVQLWQDMKGTAIPSASSNIGFLSSYTCLHIKDNAQVSFYSIQKWDPWLIHFQFQDITQDQSSKMNAVTVELGGRVHRNETIIRLAGQGAENKVLGVLFGDREQNFENWVAQNHTARKTTSDIQYRGALKDTARSFFSGMVLITKDAQQSDAYQSAKSLLLSKDARADAIPNLEILADDVKCSHGAAVGPVDEDQKFYLQSRGMTPDLAEKVIVQGFFEPVIAAVPGEPTRDHLREMVEIKLG